MDPKPQRTKLVRYGECFHVAVHDCEFVDDDFESREVDLVVGAGWVLTVRHTIEHNNPVPIDEIMRRFELQFGGKGKPEEGFLLWAVFDVLIDRYFETTEAIDDRLDDIEEQVFGSDGQEGVPEGMFALRRDLAEFRRTVAPMREVVDAISRKEVPFVCEEAIVFFRDVFDRTLRALDYIESERDLLTSLLEADLAVISNRMNDVMKKVTSWGAILLGATLIAGIYGMNFKHMPELGWSFGYPLALASMLGVMVVLYIVFKSTAGCSYSSAHATSRRFATTRLRRQPTSRSTITIPRDDCRFHEHLVRRELQRVEVAQAGDHQRQRDRTGHRPDQDRLPPVERSRLDHEHPQADRDQHERRRGPCLDEHEVVAEARARQ